MDLIDFKALQQRTFSDNSVAKLRAELDKFVDFMLAKDYQHEQRLAFIKHFKHVSEDAIIKARGFMVKDDILPSEIPSQYREDRYGIFVNNRMMIKGRFCFPVMDTKGCTMGLVAYDPFERPKYLDTPTYGYKASAFTLFGMECMEEYYTTDDPIFIVEGLGCMLFLRDNGYKSLALLGSNLTPYVSEIISRLKHPVMVGDSDAAGNKLRMKANNNLNIPILVVPPELGKDLDDARNVDEEAVFKLLNKYYIH